MWKYWGFNQMHNRINDELANKEKGITLMECLVAEFINGKMLSMVVMVLTGGEANLYDVPANRFKLFFWNCYSRILGG